MIEQAIGLFIAAILGALLGIERTIAGKQAGMRTYAMVSVGSCLFVILGILASSRLVSIFPGMNPLQLASSVIVGIGFIGSGLAIAKAGEGHAELTTASGILVVAGIGMACGFGFYMLATTVTVIAAAVLSLFLRIENKIRRKYPKQSQ
jgi:putative Mg2+ transporter-C (MgtC) family protein